MGTAKVDNRVLQRSLARVTLRDQIQTTLGDAYLVENELRGGGMSRVFVATEQALGRCRNYRSKPPSFLCRSDVGDGQIPVRKQDLEPALLFP